jgi:hypothetical protein
VVGSYWLALSFIGGAPLARHMLPAVPLIALLCVNTLRRRVPAWPALVALIVAVRAASLFINPPYSFAPEDNLAYRDFVVLHEHAAQFLESTQRRPPLLEGQGLRVLTAWPATNELDLPWEGYVQSPIPTVAMEDFTPQNLITARQRGGFDYALVFSTKYYPPHPLPMPKFWQRAQSEYFGFHRDATPAEAAQILGGEMIFQEYRGGQWAAVIEMPVIRNAALRAPQ